MQCSDTDPCRRWMQAGDRPGVSVLQGMLRVVASSIALPVLGCGLPSLPCARDLDCKGERICEDGECFDPSDENDDPADTTDADPLVVISDGQVCAQINHVAGNDQVQLDLYLVPRNDGATGTFHYEWNTFGSCGTMTSETFSLEIDASAELFATFTCPRDADGLLPVGASDVAVMSASSATGDAYVRTDGMSLDFGGSLSPSRCLDAPEH